MSYIGWCSYTYGLWAYPVSHHPSPANCSCTQRPWWCPTFDDTVLASSVYVITGFACCIKAWVTIIWGSFPLTHSDRGSRTVLENCVFTFQDKFFKQLCSATMGSPCSPVVANIYMEYFKDLALGPELPVPVKDWKRYVDDVFSIIPKGNRNKMLHYLNSIDPHIKFTIEQPNKEGAFLS